MDSTVLCVKPEEKTPQCTPNLLPCDISFTGPAPVSAYFHPSEAASDGGRTAHFRGRQLRGRHLPLPAGYEGLVLQDTVAASIADGEERRWVERGTFSELGYWKHDDPTAATDPMAKAMDFCRLAGVLHGHHAPPPQV